MYVYPSMSACLIYDMVCLDRISAIQPDLLLTIFFLFLLDLLSLLSALILICALMLLRCGRHKAVHTSLLRWLNEK